MNIQEKLLSLADKKTAEFNAKLIPSIDRKAFIGIKTPILRSLAKELAMAADIDAFLSALPHKYFEENQLHAFIISYIPDFDKAIAYLEKFLPYIDNWATCDQLSLRLGKKNRYRLLNLAERWLTASHLYTRRFAVGIYMKYFLDEDFKKEYLYRISDTDNGEYYYDMMVAWYFATALAKQYEFTIKLFEDERLGKWVHNKAIRKAIESYRVTDTHKEYLKTLIRK